MRIRSILLTLAVGTLVLVPAHAALSGNPCGMPDRWPTDPSAAVTTKVEMDWCAFIPTVAHVEPGDAVIFRNLDPQMTHTVTGVGGGMLGWDQWTGESQTWTAPDEPGVYPYACLLHPGMVGAIVVGDADAAGFVGAADGGGTSVGGLVSGTGWLAVVAVAVVVAVGTVVRLARTDSET